MQTDSLRKAVRHCCKCEQMLGLNNKACQNTQPDINIPVRVEPEPGWNQAHGRTDSQSHRPGTHRNESLLWNDVGKDMLWQCNAVQDIELHAGLHCWFNCPTAGHLLPKPASMPTHATILWLWHWLSVMALTQRHCSSEQWQGRGAATLGRVHTVMPPSTSNEVVTAAAHATWLVLVKTLALLAQLLLNLTQHSPVAALAVVGTWAHLLLRRHNKQPRTVMSVCDRMPVNC